MSCALSNFHILWIGDGHVFQKPSGTRNSISLVVMPDLDLNWFSSNILKWNINCCTFPTWKSVGKWIGRNGIIGDLNLPRISML